MGKEKGRIKDGKHELDGEAPASMIKTVGARNEFEMPSKKLGLRSSNAVSVPVAYRVRERCLRSLSCHGLVQVNLDGVSRTVAIEERCLPADLFGKTAGT